MASHGMFPLYVQLLVVLAILTTTTSGISLSTKKTRTTDYQLVSLPIESALIKEESAQILLSSLLIGSVPVPSFVSDRNVPTSFARFEASVASPPSVGRVASSSTLMDSLKSVFAKKDKVEAANKLAPIVLLHGFDSSAIEYRRLAPLIAQKRDVYIPDILGWGFSDHTNVISFTPAAKMAHLKNFITEIVGEPCVVVGASLGGAIAMLLATESPELVEKVVLIDAQGFIDGTGPSNTPDFVARFGVNVLKSTPLRMFANYIAYKDKVPRHSFAYLSVLHVYCQSNTLSHHKNMMTVLHVFYSIFSPFYFLLFTFLSFLVFRYMGCDADRPGALPARHLGGHFCCLPPQWRIYK